MALARSLCPNPRLLMLDEPFGALDRALREKLLTEMRTILKEVGVTSIFVTHDQSEAFAVSDTLAVMDQGGMEQLDSPENIYHRPETRTVARFIGHNILSGQVTETGIESSAGFLNLKPNRISPGGKIWLAIRPEGVLRMIPDNGDRLEGINISGRVEDAMFQGRNVSVKFLSSGGERLHFLLPGPFRPPQPGRSIVVQLDPEAILVKSE